MTRHWPLVAVFVANLLAAAAIFIAGKWVGETNRYDGCRYVDFMGAYFCPVQAPMKPPPDPERGDV